MRTGRFDASSLGRGVDSFTHLGYRTRNIRPIYFSCSRANCTLSDRNRCAVLLLEFVSKYTAKQSLFIP